MEKYSDFLWDRPPVLQICHCYKDGENSARILLELSKRFTCEHLVHIPDKIHHSYVPQEGHSFLPGNK